MDFAALVQQLLGFPDADFVQVAVEGEARAVLEKLAQIGAAVSEHIRQRLKLQILLVMAVNKVQHPLH
ncbi:hypothetical protein D3C81_2104320 [compost metagenome]